MACNSFLDPNRTVFADFQFWQFEDSFNRNVSCGASTYLRPDIAGALLPWLYTLAILLVHLPLVMIRVKRWERVQVVSIVLAVTAIALKSQEYRSTELAPDKVLVWMPLTLALDSGSMLQIFVLVVEESGFRNLMSVLGRDLSSKLSQRLGPGWDFWPKTEQNESSINMAQEEQEDAGPASRSRSNTSDRAATSGRAVLALCAIALFLAILGLQIAALVKASRGYQSASTVSWCSPAFESFGLSIMDGNCELHDIGVAASKGIGCIQLPATYQEDWLKRTVGILVASLALEFLDVVILVMTDSRKVAWNVEIQRPWFTMLFGIVILVILIIFGIIDASHLPNDTTERVWIFRQDDSSNSHSVCWQVLHPAGLRGSIIGWTDGVFDSFGSTYYGA